MPMRPGAHFITCRHPSSVFGQRKHIHIYIYSIKFRSKRKMCLRIKLNPHHMSSIIAIVRMPSQRRRESAGNKYPIIRMWIYLYICLESRINMLVRRAFICDWLCPLRYFQDIQFDIRLCVCVCGWNRRI